MPITCVMKMIYDYSWVHGHFMDGYINLLLWGDKMDVTDEEATSILTGNGKTFEHVVKETKGMREKTMMQGMVHVIPCMDRSVDQRGMVRLGQT